MLKPNNHLAASRTGPELRRGPVDLRDPFAHDLAIPLLSHRIGSWRFVIERDTLAIEDLQARYAALAAKYAGKLRRLGFNVAYAGLARRFVARAQDVFGPGASVLDCGAGSGALSLALADATNFAVCHQVLDLCPAMLRVASQSLVARGVQTEATCADVRSIPHAAGRFDAVVAAHVIEHLPDPVEALREMYRVTRPGGHILVVVTRRGLLGTAIQLLHRVHCPSRRQLQTWLEGSGWNELEFVPLEGPWWCDRMSMACMAKRSVDREQPGT